MPGNDVLTYLESVDNTASIKLEDLGKIVNDLQAHSVADFLRVKPNGLFHWIIVPGTIIYLPAGWV